MKNTKKVVTMIMVVCLVLQLLPIGNRSANTVWGAVDLIDPVTIDEVNFPDDNFRAYVKDEFDLDEDGVLNEEERNAVTSVNVNNKNIENLSGVEYFINLEDLICPRNRLTSLDISNNKALKNLYCFNNQLTGLDVNNNMDLETLMCDSNQLTNLNVSNNAALQILSCDFNQLTNLNVSNNMALQALTCESNKLASLNVSNNTALSILSCSETQLTSLDVSKNTALSLFLCSGNQLQDLDISMSEDLYYLDCGKNQLTRLDLSNNKDLRSLYCNGNRLTSLDLSEKEDLEYLDCSDNQLTNLDLNNHMPLVYFHCNGNQLTSLDLSKYRYLSDLNCQDNRLPYLDLSMNPYISSVECGNNIYNINGLSVDTSTIEGFDIGKASDWTNATVDGTVVTVIDPNQTTTYTYQVSEKKSETFGFITTFQVTFLDGNTVESTQTLRFGEEATAPVLNKTGYTLGWDKSFDHITENTIVNAVWTANNYSIHYHLNGGENNSSNLNEYTIESSTIALANPSRTGYAFEGWYTDSELTERVTEIAAGSTGDKTFYAKWSVVEYTIHYQLDDGENHSENPSSYNITSNNITLNEPTRTGFTFEGWYTDRAFTEQVTEIAAGSTGDKTFYAKWFPVKYTIHYQLNGGENHRENPSGYDITSSKITLKVPTRTGYTFDGWYTDGAFTEKVTEIAAGSTGDQTFYAKWSANQYKIQYQLNEGENHSENPSGYDITSSKITLKTPTRTGYTFDGWYTDGAFTEQVTEIAAGSMGDKTFYVKWSANKYKVSFNKNGGSIKTSDKTRTYTYGSKYNSLPKTTRKNHEFTGWYTKKSGGSRITIHSVVNITKNTTLYARWKKITVGKPTINKLTNPKANQIKVSIKKVRGAAGYEVLYAVNSKFRGKEKVDVKSTSFTFKNLKKGRTYYVKIRAYKKDSTGNIVYGKYSKVNKKKVTK